MFRSVGLSSTLYLFSIISPLNTEEYKNSYEALFQSLTPHMRILKARIGKEGGKEAHVVVLASLNTFCDILESIHCLFSKASS